MGKPLVDSARFPITVRPSLGPPVSCALLGVLFAAAAPIVSIAGWLALGSALLAGYYLWNRGRATITFHVDRIEAWKTSFSYADVVRVRSEEGTAALLSASSMGAYICVFEVEGLEKPWRLSESQYSKQGRDLLEKILIQQCPPYVELMDRLWS